MVLDLPFLTMTQTVRCHHEDDRTSIHLQDALSNLVTILSFGPLVVLLIVLSFINNLLSSSTTWYWTWTWAGDGQGRSWTQLETKGRCWSGCWDRFWTGVEVGAGVGVGVGVVDVDDAGVGVVDL